MFVMAVFFIKTNSGVNLLNEVIVKQYCKYFTELKSYLSGDFMCYKKKLKTFSFLKWHN